MTGGWQVAERAGLFSWLRKRVEEQLGGDDALIASGGWVAEDSWPDQGREVSLEMELLSRGAENFRLGIHIRQGGQLCLRAEVSFFCIDDDGEAKELGDDAVVKLSEISRS